MYHIPVMGDEVIAALNVKSGGLYLDGTLGGGGHTALILERKAKVVGIDRDADARAECAKRFSGEKVEILCGNYKDAPNLVGNRTFDGALLDLGVSSHQLDDGSRGFSYMHNGALDMRMDESQQLSAYDVVNTYDRERLANIIYEFGEERYSRRIAASIEKARTVKPIETTFELSDIIKASMPYQKNGHPAKKTFQAIRIEVNGELRDLNAALQNIFALLKKGGRLAVITFHSLEDRIVKRYFSTLCTDCICPKSIPVCVCNHHAEAVGFKKIKPSQQELSQNSRSHSATLRYVEKI